MCLSWCCIKKKETFFFFFFKCFQLAVTYSTPQSIISLFGTTLNLAQLCVRLSTLSLFKVSISSASLRFIDHLLIFPRHLLSLWSPLHTIFFVCVLCFFHHSLSSSLPLRRSSTSSFRLWWLSTSTCHCSTQSHFTSARQQMDPLSLPIKKRECSKKTFMFTGTSQPFLSLYSCSGK